MFIYIIKKIILLSLISVLLIACANQPVQDDAAIDYRASSQAKTPIIRNISYFDEALICMDALFAKNGIEKFFITSEGLPDATNKVQAGTREMMMSAISKMSARSDAFRYVDYDKTQTSIDDLTLKAWENPKRVRQFNMPSHYIRGAITQMDENVINSGAGLGFLKDVSRLFVLANGQPFLEKSINSGISAGDSITLVSIDLNLADILSRQIIPGLETHNSIAVKRSGVSASADVTRQSIRADMLIFSSLPFSFSIDESEGLHAATRTLLNMSLMEILGKFTGVPYWTCLGLDETSPQARAIARQHYTFLSDNERQALVKNGLLKAKYLQAKHSDVQFRAALGRYQKDHNLIANTKVGFDTYYKMLSNHLIAGNVADEDLAVQDAENKAVLQNMQRPVEFSLELSQTNNRYRLGDILRAFVNVKEDAYLYCYYQEASEKIARIFPNRFHTNAHVKAGQIIRIPGEHNKYHIKFDTADKEEAVMCLTSRVDVAEKLPQMIQVEDLAPLPMRSFEAVIKAYENTSASRIGHKIIKIFVDGE